MQFNGHTKRWEIGERELHCGDCFKLYPERLGNPIEVRIEHCDAGWYLISDYGIIQPSKRLAEVDR